MIQVFYMEINFTELGKHNYMYKYIFQIHTQILLMLTDANK